MIVVRGIRTTDPIATFIDCAGWLSLVDLVVLGDALVKKYGITADELRRACERSTDYYAGLARSAACYVRDGVDSPMESRLRMLIVLAGLPETGRELQDLLGGRPSASTPRPLLPGHQADHRVRRTPARREHGPVERDLKRREELEDEGWTILVVTATDFYKRPSMTLERVRTKLIQLGMPTSRSSTRAWREHFGS